jgi:hypothetical protein
MFNINTSEASEASEASVITRNVETMFLLNMIMCYNIISIHSSMVDNNSNMKIKGLDMLKLEKYYKCKGECIECSICIEKVKCSEYVRGLQCGHKYHKKCIDKWFRVSINVNEEIQCPLCRKRIEWY